MRLKFGCVLDSLKIASSKLFVVLIYAHVISVASAVLPLTGYSGRDNRVSN